MRHLVIWVRQLILEAIYTGSGNITFWANYSNTADDNIQMNDRLMTAFKRARAAIVEKKYTIRDAEVAKFVR